MPAVQALTFCADQIQTFPQTSPPLPTTPVPRNQWFSCYLGSASPQYFALNGTLLNSNQQFFTFENAQKWNTSLVIQPFLGSYYGAAFDVSYFSNMFVTDKILASIIIGLIAVTSFLLLIHWVLSSIPAITMFQNLYCSAKSGFNLDCSVEVVILLMMIVSGIITLVIYLASYPFSFQEDVFSTFSEDKKVAFTRLSQAQNFSIILTYPLLAVVILAISMGFRRRIFITCQVTSFMVCCLRYSFN